MSKLLQAAAERTFKREAASALMFWFMALTTYAFIDSADAARVQILEMLIFPIGTIFAGAFGLDWISKQTTIAGPPAGKKETAP